jgi:predicted amidophosphoribosyltransferase
MKHIDTYCPHCWAKTKMYDTTCCSCGNAVTPHADIDDKASIELAQIIGEMCVITVVLVVVLSLVIVALL